MTQFRYFRSMVWVPAAPVTSFVISLTGVDDAAEIVIYNSLYPSGISPKTVTTADATVGACVGNGSYAPDFKAFVQPGEVNSVLVIQADLSPTISGLGSATVSLNGTSIPTFDCTGVH